MAATALDMILEKRFFGPWREGETPDPASIWSDSNLELFVTATCDQRCEYCYLVRHNELYPNDIRDPETIKKNLRIFLNWCLEQRFSFNQVDLFSGEIWHSQFGWDILDILLEYIRRGLRIRTLMIPTNASFVLSDKALVEMANRIEDYRCAGCFLQLSGSIDGGVVDSVTRQSNSESLTERKNSDDFYDRFFSFWRRFGFRFHPMVSQENVANWKENFLWWEEKCKEYGYDAFEDIMMLEVRNDGWTQEDIKNYTEFLDFLIEKILAERFGGDVEKLANHLFLTDIFNGTGSGYINFGLTPADSFQGCTMSDMFTVRLGDLAIPPCHRTSYDNLLYGQFKVENDKIAGIEEHNAQIASRLLFQDSILCSPGCDCCPYSYFCIVMQIIGEFLEFKGKVVPEFLKIRKFFSRRKAEKEEVRLMMQRVEQKLTDVNSHYSADNITRRDEWMRKVNTYGDSIVAINETLSEVTKELKSNTSLTEEMFVQSSRDRIIDFATKVADESAVVSREEFNRTFKVYDRYEGYIKDHGLTNGEVDVSIQVIRDAYEARMKNHTFIEDIRGIG